ncbi:HCP-like protein [Suhomyces tanzawaensis NRRL Y-17324]|uniref:HCP-like protein n=1 Tax=Suhomyces tanzawaensis NRRL Y-17324 TaxID=984487 RepID=A0A1E4SH99_9ASCO|nr:HCP-like protein [Suhomyces tanzawaensis NRRL Y-17324]ODV78889.1 HCP-like protein [Suhomyces tanzawaensis NRRL Y-17324]
MRTLKSVLCLFPVLIAHLLAVQQDQAILEDITLNSLQNAENAVPDGTAPTTTSTVISSESSSSFEEWPPSGHATPNNDTRDPRSREQRAHQAYLEALSLLDTVPPREPNRTLEHVISNGKLQIPPYSNVTKNYEHTASTTPQPVPEIITSKVIPLLEEAIKLNYSPALVTLADFHMFGNYSVPPDYRKSLELYHKAVSIEGDGHAYFMLGYIYSSGLFGEVEVDQIKANLYYNLGMQNGDLNSILALAYRTYNGIGIPANYELSLHYYSRLATIGKANLARIEEQMQEVRIPLNIRISDFNGGLYGPKLSESPDSIDSMVRLYSLNIKKFEEYNMDHNDHEYVNLYFNALKHYDGGYFFPVNRTRAFEYLDDCIALGDRNYGKRMFHNIDSIDKRFLGLCYSQLGHMYYKGYGVEKDMDKARKLHEISLAVDKNGQSYNDLGTMKQSGLDGKPINETEVIEYFIKAVKMGYQTANLNLAKYLTELSPNQDPAEGDYAIKIYEAIRKSAYSGVIESWFHYAEFAQSGLTSLVDPQKRYDCQSTIYYYKVFVERLESFFLPHLRFAFDEFIAGNFQNALIGYSIAAEQGLENAQVSTAYLLYQLQPLKSKLKVQWFDPKRVKSAVKYLERSSAQMNIDSMILLGDLYLEGIENALDIDYQKAFQYYHKATKLMSSHAAYKLGYMYEYGLGTLNNSVDFFMAKRYYDLSMEYKEKTLEDPKLSHFIPIQWALIRLRLKYLFNKNKFKSYKDNESNSWFKAFKNIGKGSGSEELETAGNKRTGITTERANNRATAHHEGGEYDGDEEYDIGDYLVIGLTISFFVFFFMRNLYRFWRMRNNGDDAQRGFRFWFNGYELNFGNGDFEFRFFAI